MTDTEELGNLWVFLVFFLPPNLHFDVILQLSVQEVQRHGFIELGRLKKRRGRGGCN